MTGKKYKKNKKKSERLLLINHKSPQTKHTDIPQMTFSTSCKSCFYILLVVLTTCSKHILLYFFFIL